MKNDTPLKFLGDKTQIKKILAQNPETKNLKIADDDLLTYYHYYKNKSKESPDGYRQELKIDPFIRVVWVPTEKSNKIQFQEDFQKTNALFDSELDLQNYSFSQLITDNENKQKAFKEMQKITKKNGEIDKGFYLCGSFKTGKTFFLKTLAQQLLEQQISMMFLFMPNLIRKFKIFLNNNLLETRFEQLKTVNYLFLDDFGAENMTPWFRDEILLPLLSYRVEKKLPLFISSNYNFLQLEKHLMGNTNDNNYIRIHKIIDKINELTRFYDFSK